VKTQGELDAIVAGLRDAHWTLRAPLRTHGIRQLFRDQGISVATMPLPVPAMTVLQFGRAAISMNSALAPREQTLVLAEEYAHAKLHAGEPGELTLHLSAIGADDPREYEARYVALCLMAGPGVEVPFTVPARPAKPLPTPHRRPFMLPFPAPYEHVPIREDTVPFRREPAYGGRLGETPLRAALRRASRRIASKGTLRTDAPAPTQRLVYERDGKVRFLDLNGVPWTMWDVVRRVEKDGSVTRHALAPGQPGAVGRYFIDITGLRRYYRFSKWELRDLAERHLERQLRDATAIPQRIPEAQQDAG
jgi:hypothetical protein